MRSFKGAREDYDLVSSILRNSVEGIDKFRVSSRGHNECPAVAVELNHKYAFGVPRELQVTIGGEVVILKCLHSIFLCFFVLVFRVERLRSEEHTSELQSLT